MKNVFFSPLQLCCTLSTWLHFTSSFISSGSLVTCQIFILACLWFVRWGQQSSVDQPRCGATLSKGQPMCYETSESHSAWAAWDHFKLPALCTHVRNLYKIHSRMLPLTTYGKLHNTKAHLWELHPVTRTCCFNSAKFSSLLSSFRDQISSLWPLLRQVLTDCFVFCNKQLCDFDWHLCNYYTVGWWPAGC